MISAYYNEHDPHAAEWLRGLIARGVIAPGEVDERSIEDVSPDELAGFSQCHFFAGIGVWSYALRLAGWPDDRPIWTGSCPCQPFSAAGKGAGFDDERHLWPSWQWLIQQCRPPVVAGEQVASKNADPWIDLVHADMEAMDYAFGCVPFPAAGIGAPHIRDRNYWVSYAAQQQRDGTGDRGAFGRDEYPDSSATGRLVHGIGAGLEGYAGHGDDGARRSLSPRSVAETGSAGGLANDQLQQRSDGKSRFSDDYDAPGWVEGAATIAGLCSDRGLADLRSNGRDQGRESQPTAGHDGPVRNRATRIERPGPTNGFWRDADWLGCRDGKWRPVEPGSFPLVDGASFRLDSGSPYEGKSRQGLLKGFGNAIVAPQAADFISAVMEMFS